MKEIICENPQRRERIVDALEATCNHPVALSSAASGTSLAEPLTQWMQDVPRQAAAGKVMVVRC